MLHALIFADVKSVNEGKSVQEVEAMQETVAARLAAGEAMVAEHCQGAIEHIRLPG